MIATPGLVLRLTDDPLVLGAVVASINNLPLALIRQAHFNDAAQPNDLQLAAE